MEPFDIDKIIKEKVSKSHYLHKNEMDAAKPFVWAEIQRKNANGKSMTWVHLAAAVLLLMLCYSIVLINIQKNHRTEMKNLSAKMDQLQIKHASQTEALEMRTTQIASLTNQQEELNEKLSDLNSAPVEQQKLIVYRTDTVYLKQVEYITRVVTSPEPTRKSMEKEGFLEVKTTTNESKTRDVDDIIFPSYENQKRAPAESLKVKFGSLPSNRN